MSEHRYCRYCGYGYFASDRAQIHCGKIACKRRVTSMDFPCYDDHGKEWCMYPNRHLAKDYRQGSRR